MKLKIMNDHEIEFTFSENNHFKLDLGDVRVLLDYSQALDLVYRMSEVISQFEQNLKGQTHDKQNHEKKSYDESLLHH